MIFEFKNKKIVIFAIVILLILLAGGLFWWWNSREPDVGFVPSEEFEIQETENGKIIKHEETGLKLIIPKDWEIIDGRDGLYFNSPGFQLDSVVGPYTPPIPEKGCASMIGIKKELENTNYDILYTFTKEWIRICLEQLDHDCGYEVIEIDNNKALKHVSHVENESILGDQVRIQTPKNEKIYIFETYLFGQDRKKCAQEFDKILQTVEIKE